MVTKIGSKMRMISGYLLALFAAAFLGLSATVSADETEAEPVKQVYMVLWRGVTEAERGFMDSMMNLPRPVEFIIRNAGKSREQVAIIRQDILKRNPDLIYSFGTTVTSTLVGQETNSKEGEYIRSIPLVFNIVADPKGAGIVSDYELPGRNVTGTSHLVPIATQVAAMQELGGIKRVAVIFNPKEKNSTLQVEGLQKACEEAGLDLVRFPLPDADDGNASEHFSAFARFLADQKADITYLPSDSFLISNAKALVSASHGAGVPVFSATEGPIRKAGAYMGLVSRYYNVGQFAAYKAQQILFEGKAVSDVPVETLKRFSFIVNMDSAKALDRYPPVTIMQTAEVVKD